MLTEKEKSKLGLLYDANNDPYLLKLRNKCKDLCQKFNGIKASNKKDQDEIFKQIVAFVGKDFVVIQPFWCDYGENITIGDNFFSNHNLTILDSIDVKIGNNVFIAPNCCITTAGHPIDFEQRNKGLEFAKSVIINDNVWIGANVTILPGVQIGKNSIIGAGSVVTKSMPQNSICFGNPCKKQRQITKEDGQKYK